MKIGHPHFRAFLAVLLLAPAPKACLLADDDSLEPPWGTVHADLSGTAASLDIPYTLGAGPLEEKWRLDVVGEGHDRPGGFSSIVFDSEGNLYWVSSIGGGTGGAARLVSVSPEGSVRWFGNDGAGNVHQIGTVFGGASPVVGRARVYAAGDQSGTLAVAAYDKATGENLWTTSLIFSQVAQSQLLTPVLHRGKLYTVGLDGTKSRNVHRLDAETGNEDWFSIVSEVGIAAVGQMAFVPDAFGEGEHGIYFNGDSGGGADGIGEVYGIRITESDALFGWASEGGKVARSHVIYSESTGLLYTLTWTNYNGELYVFSPTSGLVSVYNNIPNTGHGFYDVGALDFGGESIIAGGFNGYVLRYLLTGGGKISEETAYKGGSQFLVPYWGETRVLGQLLRDAEGESVLVTATNSFQCCASHVVAVNVTRGELLWQFDTMNHNDHQFLYAGGPLVGPDGKVYYFERRADGTTALVALGPAQREPLPTAGFVVVEASGLPAGLAPGGADPCVKGGQTARCDGSCSTGKDLVYEYSADPPEGATVLPRADDDPSAEIRFDRSGQFQITLRVTSAAGNAECTREVCVAAAQPACRWAVTDLAGGPIDDADDADLIPCLTAGEAALADAGGSTGGDLVFEFSVIPALGVSIDQGDPASPLATIGFTDPGTYRLRLTARNGVGQSQCVEKRICVKSAAGAARFLPGDCNADGAVDLSDPIGHLFTLFLGAPLPPCLEACDSNGDGQSGLADVVYLLSHLFLAAPPPPAPYPACGMDPSPGPLGCGQSSC